MSNLSLDGADKHRPLSQIQLTWTDLSNITRCIFVTRKGLESYFRTKGVTLVESILNLPFVEDDPVPPVSTGLLTFLPDPAENPPFPLPWLGGAGLCFGKFFKDGAPSPLCLRTFLARQDEKLTSAGFQVTVGFDLEFFLLTLEGTPVDSTLFAETKAIRGKTWTVLSRIVTAIESFEIPIWRYHAGSAPGQFEIAIGPFQGSTLAAADTMVLVRETIYHIAAEFGTKATFVPKPFKMEFPSGAHVHLSLQTKDGANLFKVRPLEANSFLAGIYENLPNMMLILAPTGNSYERLQPGTSSGTFHCIGTDNKEAAIQLVKKGGYIEKFQVKPPDGTANPYLLLGSLIGAGLEGIRSGSSIPPEVGVAPGSLPETQPPRLPRTLLEAIKSFEENEFNRELYGESLTETIVSLRTKENEFWEATSDAERMEMLLRRY